MGENWSVKIMTNMLDRLSLRFVDSHGEGKMERKFDDASAQKVGWCQMV